MDENARMQLRICRAFISFCVNVIKNESANAHRDKEQRQTHETVFSDLSPSEMNQLYCNDSYFQDDKVYFIAKRDIPIKLLEEALFSLPEEKKRILELYFVEKKSDQEIGELCHMSRSTVQYRRVTSLKLLKRFLEEHTNEF